MVSEVRNIPLERFKDYSEDQPNPEGLGTSFIYLPLVASTVHL